MSEEKEPIINGIDVSKEIRYCNNCNNLGLDFKTGKFYCGLSNRKDELPEILSCENFSSNCYIKCLQKENELLNNMVKVNDSTKYDYSKLIEENKRLQQENERLKKIKDDFFKQAEISHQAVQDKNKIIEKLETVIQEIRNVAEKLITETPEYHSCYYKDECGDNCTPKKQSKVEYCCYENIDKILTIINEV